MEFPEFLERLSTALIFVTVLGKVLSSTRVISGFSREEDENCALLGCYAESSGNFLPTFRDNLSIPSSRVKNKKIWGR